MPYSIATSPPNPDLDPLLSHFELLNYRGRRDILRRLARPALTRFLYKYRPLVLRDYASDLGSGPFTTRSVENLRDIVVRSVLRLSCPAAFNDPFDTMAHLHFTGTDIQRTERLTAMLREQGLPESEVLQTLTALRDTPNEKFIDGIRAAYDQHRATVGVCCFAGDPRSTLMWTHYAAEHTGVCLQFERVNDLATFVHALPVQYKIEYPEVNWMENVPEGLLGMLMQKHPDWSYEHEYRIIIDNAAGSYIRFRPEALRRIILGCRSDDKINDLVASLLEERRQAGLPPLQKYRVSLHARRYDLVIRKCIDRASP
jgi:Protein of unknown function (DUF2971)